MKKSDVMKIILLNANVFWWNEYIFCYLSYELLFFQHFSNPLYPEVF